MDFRRFGEALAFCVARSRVRKGGEGGTNAVSGTGARACVCCGARVHADVYSHTQSVLAFGVKTRAHVPLVTGRPPPQKRLRPRTILCFQPSLCRGKRNFARPQPYFEGGSISVTSVTCARVLRRAPCTQFFACGLQPRAPGVCRSVLCVRAARARRPARVCVLPRQRVRSL